MKKFWKNYRINVTFWKKYGKMEYFWKRWKNYGKNGKIQKIK